MNSQDVNDFNALFTLVCARHQGPARVDFGLQRFWDGIIAGECSQNIRFLQAEGVSAVFDTGLQKLRFNEGSSDMLHQILEQKLGKEMP